ncbi:hypothetical protein MMC31_002344 [Peltigera leucophlebia]|nr:hypothetical protein [Peltigera leucophlebia]
MFGNLPVELLREIVGHIHRPSHLQTLCLVSKAMSSIATQFLYRDLVLDHASDKYAQEEMLDVVKSDGLRFVKTLRVGPMMPILVAPFNHVIAKLQDHSLINFEWDSFLPPLDSQLAFIWDHQWNIQSIDLGEMSLSDAFKAICPRKSLKFPQKFVHMSLSWPHEEDLLEKFDLSVMRELTVRGNLWDNLPSCVSANLANLQLHWTSLFGSKLELDQFTSLLSLGLYRCRGAGSILSKFKNPKLKKFWYEPDWKPEDETDLEEPYAFLRKFQGLETLVIQVPAQRCPANCLKNLTDSISFEHNGTLRSVTFLGACIPKDGDSYANDSRSVLNAVIACTHLIQLELPTEWRTKETDFKVCVFCLKPTIIGSK